LQAAPAADHSIWSFCYAKGKVPRDFIEGAPVASNQGLIEIPMVYSVVATAPKTSRRRVFLVDTGFSSGRSMTGRAFADFEPPAAVLAKVALAPRDVEAILLTHLHFDHVGNIDAFPQATIYVQRSEHECWTQALREVADAPADKSNWVLSSMNPQDMVRLERARADGRVVLVDGSHEVAPGLTLHLAADTHTFGSQWVEVATRSGAFAIAGDAVVSYANLERMWPPGYHQGCAWNLLRCYRRLKSLVGETRIERIVPGHDMELFRRWRAWHAGNNPAAELHLAEGERSFAAGAAAP
jgi:glyoxylase-like metal-dependent hydrolase (beta-lactamase superfamily II)